MSSYKNDLNTNNTDSILKNCHKFSSVPMAILHYVKNIVLFPFLFPFRMATYQRTNKLGGSSSSYFRDANITANVIKVSSFLANPTNYDKNIDYDSINTNGKVRVERTLIVDSKNYLGKTIFETTEIAIYRTNGGHLIGVERGAVLNKLDDGIMLYDPQSENITKFSDNHQSFIINTISNNPAHMNYISESLPFLKQIVQKVKSESSFIELKQHSLSEEIELVKKDLPRDIESYSGLDKIILEENKTKLCNLNTTSLLELNKYVVCLFGVTQSIPNRILRCLSEKSWYLSDNTLALSSVSNGKKHFRKIISSDNNSCTVLLYKPLQLIQNGTMKKIITLIVVYKYTIDKSKLSPEKRQEPEIYKKVEILHMKLF